MRKFITGQTKYADKEAFFCIIIYKFEFDLVKCFRDEFFQELINRENNEEKAEEAEKEAYKTGMIADYMG